MNTQPTRQPNVILVVLAVCMALQMTGFVMILPLYALRFESFGAGVRAFSLSSLAYALTGMISAPIMGMLADRFGRRPIILFSLAAYVLAFTGYLFASSAGLFILLRGLAGAFTAGLIPAMIGTASDLSLEHRRAQWIGIVNGGAAVGWIAGPYFGGLLNDQFGYVVPFAVSILMELAALLLAMFLVPETQPLTSRPAGAPRAGMRGFQALPAVPAFYLLMLISFGVMFTWAFIEPQFMFYAYDDLGWTSSRLGLVMSTWGLACMFSEFALGHLSDRLGRKPVLVLGLALFSAQYFGLVIFRDATWIVVSFMLAGLGNGIFDPALSAHLLDISPPEHSARIIGFRTTAGSIGNMVGPALVVLFTPLIGPQLIFLIASALILVLTLAAAFALRTPQRTRAAPGFSDTAVSR